MSDELKSGLQKMPATHGVVEPVGLPAPPLPALLPEMRSEEEQTCLKALEEMVMIHKKYEDIINKIKSGEGQLFLIKCKTSQGEYHFLARYKRDTFGEYMQENGTFPMIPNPCDAKTAKKYNTLKKFEEQYNKGPPSLFFNFVHQKKDSDEEQIKLGTKYFPYEDFKKSIIPINEAFMYKNMIIEDIGTGHIVNYTPETQEKQKREEVVEEEGVTHEIISPAQSEEFLDVNEDDGTHVSDIERTLSYEDDGIEILDENDDGGSFGGKKKKKKRKKRSRSKKRRRRRKNNTKKN